jgi:hypothetical protein
MAIKWEWKLADATKQTFYGSKEKPAGITSVLSATSCALAFQWLKLTNSTTAKEDNFSIATLKNVKGPAGDIGKKGFPGADPAAFWGKLEAEHGLTFAPGGKGSKLSEIGAALKKLGTEGHAIVYLYNDKNWHVVPVQLNKAPIRAFDPYQGELSSKDAAEIGDEIARAYAQFTGFVISKVGQHASAKEGPGWDWDFDQGKMIDNLESGKYSATRSGGTLQKLYPKDCEGICLAMSFDWIKTNMAGKAATSAAYLDPKKFVTMAKVQKKTKDDLTRLIPLAKKDGYTIFDSPLSPKDPGYLKNLMGYFNKTTKDFVFKIDQLKPGFYILWTSGEGGHFTAFQKTGKETGKFFDPNIGQATVSPGGESLGALIGAVYEDLDMYKKDFVNYPTDPTSPWDNVYFFSQVTK